MKLLQLTLLAALTAATGAQAQTQATPQLMAQAPSPLLSQAAPPQGQPELGPPPARARPSQPDSYLPPALRRPLGDVAPGAILRRYQAMQKLKQRFDSADMDGSGTLSRDEARKAGLGFIDKHFDHIDSARHGAINFDDLKAWLVQRQEEASSR